MDAPALLRRLRAELGEALGLHARALAALDGAAALVLTYHRVLPPERARALCVEPGMVVAPETFRRHCRWLADAMRVLPLDEIVERASAGRALPPRACAISFDDGWRDNHDHAWPALREAGLPATVFVVTGRIGTPGAFWTDDVVRSLAGRNPEARLDLLRQVGLPPCRSVEATLATLKALPEPARRRAVEALLALAPSPAREERELLAWEEVERMAADGVAIESHGHGHLLLPRVSLEEARRDLSEAAARLRERGLGRARLLAYPGGDHDAPVRKLAAECGYRAAFTTRTGLVRPGDPAHALARVGVHEDVSASRAELRRRLAVATRRPHDPWSPGSGSASAMRRTATSPASR